MEGGKKFKTHLFLFVIAFIAFKIMYHLHLFLLANIPLIFELHFKIKLLIVKIINNQLHHVSVLGNSVSFDGT